MAHLAFDSLPDPSPVVNMTDSVAFQVGKTLTAESIAEVVQKPLVALSVGDLIREESEIQTRLETEFKRAIDWDAILLLDEADVVLEARSFEDLRRNSIVSSKSYIRPWLPTHVVSSRISSRPNANNQA
jgi:SpoVK/Ycf46/Vps4 family AAA+-type ATPase